MDFWCDKQGIDEKGAVICLAHLAEGRALNCPWKSNDERVKAEYFCSDYQPIKRGYCHMDDGIKEFKGKYFFLSNFYAAPVTYQGIRFENNEAAFQAAKCPERMDEFRGLAPNRAKQLGRKVPLRPDWEDVKYGVMYDICMAKFTQNPDLLSRLLATGDAELIEGNTWGDQVWGVYNGIGENHLGKILMKIRSELNNVIDKFCEAPRYHSR